MKKFLLCLIVLSMGVGFSSSPVMAQGVDPHGKVYVDSGGIGDLLLFSLYDVRPVDGRSPAWENYIAIENTTGRWTAFHLRFRAWKKSIEVFDHVILLSPYDVFWMTLSLAGDPGAPNAINGGLTTYPCDSLTECPEGFEPYEAGDVLMNSHDTETLVNSGLIWQAGDLFQTMWLDKFQDSMLVFNGFYDANNPGRAPKSEMQAGYIEAIGLWSLSIPGDEAEDTHELAEVVNDVHKDQKRIEGAINVYDALDALFYRFFTSFGKAQANNRTGTVIINPPGYPFGNVIYDCRDERNFVGCWSAYPVVPGEIDSAWPDFAPLDWIAAPPVAPDDYAERSTPFGNVVKIERVTNKAINPGDLLVYIDEAPKATRYGEDCGNVLTGNVIFGDPSNGKFQMENFIALRNFRTDYLEYDPDLQKFVFENWRHDYYGLCAPPPAPPFDWRHRDGFPGGGIFFPASTTKWFYGIESEGVYTGGSYPTYLWYYGNQNVTTGAGPTLVDGDDKAGLNFNEAQGAYPWFAPIPNYWNPMVDNYGLLRPFPSGMAIVEPFYSYVHYFNDIWSLDDVEVALAKFRIWYTHLTFRKSQDVPFNLDTDVVMTYPTKHHHFFFTDWPFMWKADLNLQVPNTCDIGTPADPLDHPVTDPRQYWANLLNYRGNETLGLEIDGFRGLKDIEQLYVFGNPVEVERLAEVARSANYNNGKYTFAQWFQARWWNGRIYAKSYLWDAEENMPKGDLPPPPPGSPWQPDPEKDVYLPHEVNIIRAGYASDKAQYGDEGIGIGDANWLLKKAGLSALYGDFQRGHFSINPGELRFGQRYIYTYFAPYLGMPWPGPSGQYYKQISYRIPPIGMVIHNHDFGTSQAGVTRSAMAEWHYESEWIKLLPIKN